MPKDNSLVLRRLKEIKVAVLSFSGRCDQSVIFNKAVELQALLRHSRMKYDRHNWLYARYDPPDRLSQRHNEIWIEIVN